MIVVMIKERFTMTEGVKNHAIHFYFGTGYKSTSGP